MGREHAPRLPMAEVIRQARFIGQVSGAEDPMREGQTLRWLAPGSILLNRLPAAALREVTGGRQIFLAGTPPRPKTERDYFDRRNLFIVRWLVLADDKKILAAFPLQNFPAQSSLLAALPAAGEPELRVAGDTPSILVADLLKTIMDIQSGKGTARDAARLDSVNRAARHFAETPVTHEVQMLRAKKIAARIRTGMMTRQQVAMVFPEQDGGLSWPGEGRYYLGAEVKANVPYEWKPRRESQPTDRVNGLIRLYRQMEDVD